MAVNACMRGECDGDIGTRRVFRGSLYICSRCYEELLELKATWKLPMTKADMRRRVAEFMETNPGDYQAITTETEAEKAFEELMGEPSEDL